MKIFEFDKIIGTDQFCNFTTEKKRLLSLIENGECLKVFGPRNFGKTSLVKNICAKEWEAQDKNKRYIIYADFYSSNTLEDISEEILKSFYRSINSKKKILEKSFEWIKGLKNLRPTWSISTSSSGEGIGEFSFKMTNENTAPDFEEILELINDLSLKQNINFLLIFDEFQEIHKIKKAEAKLRGKLQEISSKNPVIILGSKQHLLNQIFQRPKAPFYQWGATIEMGPIQYESYNDYINERFILFDKSISLSESIYLQDKVNRIPESINKLCDFILKHSERKNISQDIIDEMMLKYIDYSRSVFESVYNAFNKNQRSVLLAFARAGEVEKLSGKIFLQYLPHISKTGVLLIINHLIEDSVISHCQDGKSFSITDPFFKLFLEKYKM
jgi:hypothetical protein